MTPSNIAFVKWIAVVSILATMIVVGVQADCKHQLDIDKLVRNQQELESGLRRELALIEEQRLELIRMRGEMNGVYMEVEEIRQIGDKQLELSKMLVKHISPNSSLE